MATDVWSQHPADYRQQELQRILAWLRAGESVALTGLSGMGKSNLVGYFCQRVDPAVSKVNPVYVDINRLPALEEAAFFESAQELLGAAQEQPGGPDGLAAAIDRRLEGLQGPLTLVLDGLDELVPVLERPFFNNLRALRDERKYRLTYLVATRKPLAAFDAIDKLREFNDLFVAQQLWLGPLNEADARWSLERVTGRHGVNLPLQHQELILALSGRHPGLLKALAAAWLSDEDPEQRSAEAWLAQPALARECEMLWDDLPASSQASALADPTADPVLQQAGLYAGQAWFSPIFDAYVAAQAGTGLRFDQEAGQIVRGPTGAPFDLTAKEHLLLAYLLEHSGQICEKDTLIRAVWPEDKIYDQGVRDDSLAQLVRRVRVKIEANPSEPQLLHTIPGRGYRLDTE